MSRLLWTLTAIIAIIWVSELSNSPRLDRLLKVWATVILLFGAAIGRLL